MHSVMFSGPPCRRRTFPGGTVDYRLDKPALTSVLYRLGGLTEKSLRMHSSSRTEATCPSAKRVFASLFFMCRVRTPAPGAMVGEPAFRAGWFPLPYR